MLATKMIIGSRYGAAISDTLTIQNDMHVFFSWEYKGHHLCLLFICARLSVPQFLDLFFSLLMISFSLSSLPFIYSQLRSIGDSMKPRQCPWSVFLGLIAQWTWKEWQVKADTMTIPTIRFVPEDLVPPPQMAVRVSTLSQQAQDPGHQQFCRARGPDRCLLSTVFITTKQKV